MASSIDASTSGAGGVITTADNTGILQLKTAGTTAVTVDASQNVGIGTTSPFSAAGYKSLTINGSTTGILAIQANGSNSCYLYSDGSAFNIKGVQNIPMDFYTNDTQRMRIDSSGNVLMGVTAQRYGTCRLVAEATSNQAAFLGTNYSGDVSNAAVYISKYDNNTTTSQIFVRFIVNNISSGSGQINANGASAAAFGSWSDERLKENIEPLPSQLNNILALKPSEFDYKGYEDGMGHQIGFIAQDMQKVYPDVVSEGEDGMLMITGWDKTSARLVKAIQEQQTIINDLKARVTALEAK